METTREPAYVPGEKVHQFELAGLGKAPYRLVGCEYKTFQACHGAPIQPGASCDYCGTGIMLVFTVCSADGRRFKVGCDCVLKTDSDKAFRVAVLTEKQKHERALRAKRAEVKRLADCARIAAARATLPIIADALRAEPHPQAASYDFLRDKTRLDWAEWMLDNAGMSGKLSVAKVIEDMTR